MSALIQNLLYTVLYIVVAAVAATPVFIQAHRADRPTTRRNFLIGAVGVGVAMGILRYTSEALIQSCYDAGHRQCSDPGGAGMALVLGTAFVFVAWIRAWQLLGR